MERFFQISAVILIASSAVFYLYGKIDGVFIAIVLACLSYFLSVRTQVKGRLAEREAARMELEEGAEPPAFAEEISTSMSDSVDR